MCLQACLGSSAKPNERNVVELTTDDQEGDSITCTLLSMSVGGIEQVCLGCDMLVSSAYTGG